MSDGLHVWYYYSFHYQYRFCVSIADAVPPTLVTYSSKGITSAAYSHYPSTMRRHEKTVQQIAETVMAFYTRREPFRIYHGSTNSTRPAHKDHFLDISKLSNIIDIDTESRIARVEPNVPMDKLVEATLKHNLIPPVVMEFPGITVGGGYAGSAAESSSFKFGYFDQTVNSVEMILATGELVTASRTNRPDLFKGAAGALGTLGITTLLELQLIKAKRFVKTTYLRTSNINDTLLAVRRATEDTSNDYVDGIIFSKSHGVVITGQLTEDKPESIKSQAFSKPWDPWYYLHVEEATRHNSNPAPPDYVPLAEYLFRYDRGGFWVGNEAFRYFPFIPFNKFTRWFLNDFMHTRMLYRALHSANSSFRYVVQDLSLPYSSAADFIDYTSKEFGIWPLWLCPLREMNGPTFHPQTNLPGPGSDPKPMLNIGLWGRGSRNLTWFMEQNRRLEAKLTKLGGRKVFYSHTYYTEEEFWSLYNRKWYENLRERHSATTLPTVYDKIKHRTVTLSWWQRMRFWWPFAGILGIASAIRSKDYLLHRQPHWISKTVADERRSE